MHITVPLPKINNIVMNSLLQYLPISAISCVWGHWGEFGECDTLCGDGLRERKRVHEIVAEYGGEDCQGSNTDTKACNVLEETRLEVAEQKARIEELEKELAGETGKSLSEEFFISQPQF